MIGVIVINYHSEEKTIEFVRTELAKIRSDYAVVMVMAWLMKVRL